MSAEGTARGSRAGFVLVGGNSSRMGRDKALLPLNGVALAGHIASQVLLAAGDVTLVGRPERYEALGYPVLEDRVMGCGPLGGVYTALCATQAEWNLIVACDMPEVTVAFMAALLDAAAASGADCLVPQGEAGLEPLCAVYHRRCAAAAASSITRKMFKMQDFVSNLQFVAWPVTDSLPLANFNTPAQWGSR